MFAGSAIVKPFATAQRPKWANHKCMTAKGVGITAGLSVDEPVGAKYIKDCNR